MNWISVKEKLPDESRQYLVCAKDGLRLRVTIASFWLKNKTWQLTERRSYWCVTHWMPLPEPPKEDEI